MTEDIHTPEDRFQHFLSYSNFGGHPQEKLLRKAFYAGADVAPPLDDPCWESVRKANAAFAEEAAAPISQPSEPQSS